MRQRALSEKLAIAFDISFAETTYVYVTLDGASPDNADWIRRKKNSVRRFHKSSYALLLDCERRGQTLEQRYGCDPREFVAAGGCFPLRIRGSSGVVGSMTVSGLSGREDHELVVQCLAERLGMDLSAP